ncbi:fimbrial protein [Yersinia intermedia]|uniref:fimbrial protein n=1 Tax=Yersinia intermedia TaxID=631 RepID=UPI001F531ED4|nr:fimbrial protein [Yersinia intermedia]UNK24182.1 fimbrial protein [Yersinia intermedia]
MNKGLIAISLLALSSSAFAIDGTIQFTGAFTDSPCEININGSTTTGSSSASVVLDTWNVTNYKSNVGATTDLKPITISLSGCPAKTQANIQFNGTVNTTNPKLFAIQTGADAASNVGIALYSSSNTADIITPNTRDLSIPLTAQDGEKIIYASYMTTGADVGQGEANADVTIDISYE